MKKPPPGESRPGWPLLFRRASDPVFVLNRARRIRFVNSAWESTAKRSADDVIGLRCTRRRSPDLDPIAWTLCPPRDVMRGIPSRIRRPVPGARVGPPWWDIFFQPYFAVDGLLGIVGQIRVVGSKPASNERSLPEALNALRFRSRATYSMDRLQGDDLTVQRMLEQVRLAGQLREPVWLEGEPGTGKRFVSRVIHYCGVTSEQPYVTVDVPRLPFEAAAELLFGEHGLGRPERVGTIYVREPARLPRELQEMLAEFLADRPPNGPRVIAGSSKDPGDELTAGRLLPSLFYRLSIQRILLQPLRSRVAELPRLLSAAIERHGVAGQPSVLGPEIVEILARYTWPGNYRELEEVAASLVRAASGAKIEVAHIPQHVRRSVEAPEIPRTASPALDLNTVLRQIESKLVLRALRACKGNKTKAAEMLGIPRLGLLSRMKTLGVRDE